MAELALRSAIVPIRDSEKGLVRIRGHVCRGIGVTEHQLDDEVATAEAERRWRLEEWEQRGPRPDQVIRSGFRLSHENSGLLITPGKLLLPDMAAVKACLRAIFDRVPADLFEGPAEHVRRLGPLVLQAHRSAGVWRGNAAALDRLDASIDEAAWRAGLAKLKAAKPCEAWREYGVTGWGDSRADQAATDDHLEAAE
ncbi:hypothetical protein CSC94_05970 [Zhengella mangrovi]|uniref:Uncharacterized protein n=1 Tax=Zhengella mangrovi TaxID=1982044 RepID=A0A2G1QRM9_9HYPH|nr:hypothetical protein [Zhengella mangrovi]PHP68197.1 hypothetical protein CSC94_05970 [Zhengella mangrovi]